MGDRFSGSIVAAAIAATTTTAIASAVITISVRDTAAQAPAVSASTLRTPWGEPDLQGIWTDEFDTPMQRSPRYANQEFFTEAQRADLDKERGAILTRFATEREINGAYNAATFFSTKRTGARTSKVVDPPNGRLPPLTPKFRRGSPPSGSIVSPWCDRPTPARTNCRAVQAGATTRRHRRGAPRLRRATIRRG